jgi:hypothetical protein
VSAEPGQPHRVRLARTYDLRRNRAEVLCRLLLAIPAALGEPAPAGELT